MEDGGSPFDEGRYRYVKLGQPESDERPQSVAPPSAAGSADRGRRGRVLDRVIGILLGLVLGIGIVTAFVFLGSEDTIDAPRIQNGGPQAEQNSPQNARDGQSSSQADGGAGSGSRTQGP